MNNVLALGIKGLHLDAGAYASYGLNTAPQSPIGSECVDVKGEAFSTDLWGHLSEHSWRVAQVNVDEIEEREKYYIDDTTILCS